MKKDKITIAYILITITVIIFASIYFIKLDFEESNSNIKKGAKQAFNTGKIYSDKMYVMLNGYAADFMNNEDNVTETKVPATLTPKVTAKPVLTHKVKSLSVKPLPISKLKKTKKMLEKKKKKNKVVSTGRLTIGNTTNKQLIKETL